MVKNEGETLIVSIKEISKCLKLAKYTNIKKLSALEFSALNMFGESRKFLIKELGNDIEVISERNLLEALNNKANIQLIQAELETDSGQKILLDDYVINRSMEGNVEAPEIVSESYEYTLKD